MSPTEHLLGALVQREQGELDACLRAQGAAERACAEQTVRRDRLADARDDIARRLARAVDAGLDPGLARNRVAWLAGLDAQLRAASAQVAAATTSRDAARARTARQQLKVESLERHRQERAAHSRRARLRRDALVADRDWLVRQATPAHASARHAPALDGDVT